jgi:hypothetical protein
MHIEWWREARTSGCYLCHVEWTGPEICSRVEIVELHVLFKVLHITNSNQVLLSNTVAFEASDSKAEYDSA